MTIHRHKAERTCAIRQERAGSRILASFLQFVFLLVLLAAGKAWAQAPTSTSITGSANYVYAGEQVTLTATVTGSTSPSGTGTVTFKHKNYNSILATVPVTQVVGTTTSTASFSTVFGSPDAYSIIAVYSGDSTFAGSTSSDWFLTVKPPSDTATVLSANPASADANQLVQFTATVSVPNNPGGNPSPTGLVGFYDNNALLGKVPLNGNTATLQARLRVVGSHSVHANYEGDVANYPSAYFITVPVSKATPSVTLVGNPSPAFVDQSIAIIANVSGASPGGTVTFKEGATTIGSATLSNGTAQISRSFASPGVYNFSATYEGDANNNPGGPASWSQTVTAKNASTTVLSASPSTAYVNQNVTLVASVAGASPGGSVTFKDGATTIGSAPLTNGQASLTTSFAAAGVHELSASYSGDAANLGSTSAVVSKTVNAAGATTTTLGVSANPAAHQQAVTLTAVVAGNSPTGTVTFKDGDTLLATIALADGTASLARSFATAGTHALTVTYNGDISNAPSTSSVLVLQVSKELSGTSLSATPGTVHQGQAVTLQATVTGANPTGSVTFSEAGTTLGSAPLSNGTASFSHAFSVAGGHIVTATYSGDSENDPSSASAGVMTEVGPVPPVSATPVVNYEYDAEGNLTKTVQAPGVAGFNFTTQSTYDRLNRVKDTTDAKSGVIKLEYDGLDRTTKVTDPRNLATQYNRNGLGDVKQQVSPDTGVTNLSYDAAGNLKGYTDSRGVSVNYTYDELSRLKMASFAQTGQTTIYHQWQYDRTDVPYGIGRVGNMLHPAGSWGTTYDAWGNILTNRQQLNSIAGGNSAQLIHTVSYGYTDNQLTSITYPSGRKLSFTLDQGVVTGLSLAANATATPVPLISEVQWEPFGPVKGWKWNLSAGPQTHERIYDTSGRTVRYWLGDTIRDLTYDAAGRISSYVHYDASTGAAQAGLNQAFQYDELGRLKQVTLNAGYWSFEYDANGNRTSATASGNTSAYAIQATSNRIASITNPARTFTYDNAGNTTADGNYTATYDLPGRMKTLTKGGVTTTYTYDAEGRRIRKFSSTGAASTVVFFYDQWGHLLSELDSTGKAIREYVWLGDTPVAVFTPDLASAANPPLVYFLDTDHIDTPRVIVDKNNNARWRWMAEPFGVNAPETNPSGLGNFTFNLRFPGQYFDAESGLHYNYFRYYGPGEGRYTTPDPIGLSGGDVGLYNYVSSNPLRYTDPNGLQAVPRPPLPVLPPPVIRPSDYPSATPASVPSFRNPFEGMFSTPRPKDMTRLEERQFDRVCVGADDPCRAIKDEANKAIDAALPKMENMLADKDGMFGGIGWINHRNDLNGRIAQINALISLGQKMGCDMSVEIVKAMQLQVPTVPRPK